jgi:hypothetical protein
MSGGCSMHGKGEECIQGFGGRIILRWTVDK